MAAVRRCYASATATKFADSAQNWLSCLEPSREVLDSTRHLCAREHYARPKHRVPARSRLARPTRCRIEAESLGAQARNGHGRQETLFAELHGVSRTGWIGSGQETRSRLTASGRSKPKRWVSVLEDYER